MDFDKLNKQGRRMMKVVAYATIANTVDYSSTVDYSDVDEVLNLFESEYMDFSGVAEDWNTAIGFIWAQDNDCDESGLFPFASEADLKVELLRRFNEYLYDDDAFYPQFPKVFNDKGQPYELEVPELVMDVDDTTVEFDTWYEQNYAKFEKIRKNKNKKLSARAKRNAARDTALAKLTIAERKLLGLA